MPTRAASLAVGLALAALWPAASWACPVCDSETGQQVRVGIFDESFASTLMKVLAPFPLFVGLLWLVDRGSRRGAP